VLLNNDKSEQFWQYFILCFGLAVLIPVSCLMVKRKSKEIAFFHPGQEKLGCILIIETFIFLSCLAVYIYAYTTTYESYTAQMLAFYIFFAGIHLIMLLLQNALAIVESKNHPNSHHGSRCVRLCPVIIFSFLFLILAAIQIAIICMQVAQVKAYSSYTLFYIFHSVTITRIFDWALFGCAGIVQLIKICNFLSHREGHSVYEK